MKKTVFLSSLLLSSIAFADVDYTPCLGAGGMFGSMIDKDGQLHPLMGQPVISKKTEGKKETYILGTAKNSYGGIGYGLPTNQEVTLERDDQGRVVKIVTGGEKVTQQMLKDHKEATVQNAVLSGIPMGGMNPIQAWEPSFWVKKKGYVPSKNKSSNTADNNSMDGYEMKKLSNVSKDEAAELGLGANPVEQLNKLKKEWKNDKKSLDKIRDGYSKILEKTPSSFNVGSESEFEFKDNKCVVKRSAARVYNPYTKDIAKVEQISKEDCDEYRRLYKKHEEKIVKCGENDATINKDFNKLSYELGMKSASQGHGFGYGYGTTTGTMAYGMGSFALPYGGQGAYGPYTYGIQGLVSQKQFCDMLYSPNEDVAGVESNNVKGTTKQ